MWRPRPQEKSPGMLALSIVYADALVWISAIAQHFNTRLLAKDQPGPLPVLAERHDLHPRPVRQPPGFLTFIGRLASSRDSPSR